MGQWNQLWSWTLMIKVHMHVRCALCTTPCQTGTTKEGLYAMVRLVIHSLATQDEKAPTHSKCNGLAEVGMWADGARLHVDGDRRRDGKEEYDAR